MSIHQAVSLIEGYRYLQDVLSTSRWVAVLIGNRKKKCTHFKTKQDFRVNIINF